MNKTIERVDRVAKILIALIMFVVIGFLAFAVYLIRMGNPAEGITCVGIAVIAVGAVLFLQGTAVANGLLKSNSIANIDGLVTAKADVTADSSTETLTVKVAEDALYAGNEDELYQFPYGKIKKLNRNMDTIELSGVCVEEDAENEGDLTFKFENALRAKAVYELTVQTGRIHVNEAGEVKV